MRTATDKKKTGHSRRIAEHQTAARPIRYTDTFKVARSTELLDFLYARLKGMARNSVKGLLASRKVVVNGNPVTQFDYPLAKDDEVRIAHSRVALLAGSRKAAPADSSLKRMLIYEDADFIAVNKPAGLLSVESDKDNDCAYVMVSAFLQARGKKVRPYVLHRIDKETSGVLVFAKDIRIQSKLRLHWNQDVTMREYYAIVAGRMDEPTGTLVDYLFENANNVVLISRTHSGKRAVTHYEVIAETRSYSLLRVTIDTGRKNQIRVQMANIGHPVVGDDKYSDGISPIGRLGLHASELDFLHPETGQPIILRAPLPPEFRALFKDRPDVHGRPHR